MTHAPFIIAAYAVAAVVLTWCGLTPIWRKKAAVRAILQRRALAERAAGEAQP